MADKAQDLQQLIVLSQAMLIKAQEELWEDVIALEVERNELIKLFFSEQVRQDEAAAVAEAIQLILSIDKQVTELGAVRRFDILQILQDLDQGKKAVKAYTS
jgi:Flagellar protein FliT